VDVTGQSNAGAKWLTIYPTANQSSATTAGTNGRPKARCSAQPAPVAGCRPVGGVNMTT